MDIKSPVGIISSCQSCATNYRETSFRGISDQLLRSEKNRRTDRHYRDAWTPIKMRLILLQEFPTDLRMVVVSEGKSILPSDFQIHLSDVSVDLDQYDANLNNVSQIRIASILMDHQSIVLTANIHIIFVNPPAIYPLTHQSVNNTHPNHSESRRMLHSHTHSSVSYNSINPSSNNYIYSFIIFLCIFQLIIN